MKTFNDLIFKSISLRKGQVLKRAEVLFENGLGASVIEYTYDDGIKFEVGVLEHKNFESKTVKLSNLYGGPLIPRLSKEGVTLKLIEIQEYLNHGTNRKEQDRPKRPIKQSGDENTSYHF